MALISSSCSACSPRAVCGMRRRRSSAAASSSSRSSRCSSLSGSDCSCSIGGKSFASARLDLPDVHSRAHAPGPGRSDPRGDSRGDDEHALRRDQFARGGDDARHLPAAVRKQRDDAATLRFGKLSALAWGVVLTGGALLYKEQGTPVVVVALSIASFTYGALLGGFFLGILWRRAIQRDAILGMSVAIVVMSFIVFAKQLVPVFLR